MRLSLSIVLGALLITAPAARAGGKSDARLISTGAGVAAPSDTSALLENPAGFTQLQEVKLLFTGSTEDDTIGVSRVGAGVFLGNGKVGGAVKFDTDTEGNATQLIAGIGVEIDAIKSSVGATCDADVGSSLSVSCSHFGLIYGKSATPRFGLNLLTAGTPVVGAGVAGEVAQSVTLALDGSMATTGGGSAIKPGLAVSVSQVQLAVGYGIDVNAGGNAMIREGLSVGLGVAVGGKLHIQAYYQQLALYFAGLALSF